MFDKQKPFYILSFAKLIYRNLKGNNYDKIIEKYIIYYIPNTNFRQSLIMTFKEKID